MQIAIDGPAASGKSTVAREVARRLGYTYVDTGAMYRAVTWAAVQRGIFEEDAEALARLARDTRLEIRSDAAAPSGYRVWADGEDVTPHLIGDAVNRRVSQVSSVSAVRRILVARQREMAREKPVVMAGRDIGTVVLPHAPLKVYLTASMEERVRRRLEDMGEETDPETARHSVQGRDVLDSTREDSPLKPAPDAVMLDSTGLSVDQVVERILLLVQERSRRKEPCSTDSPASS